MEKETIKNSWINARLILILIAVIFLFSFSAKRNSERKIKKTEVIFVGNEDLFITHETVNKLLIEKNQSVQKLQKVTVDLNKLENSLDHYSLIEKSEVFISIDGVLKAFVKQKSPIARVFNENGSFYFDYQGNKMPLSENFTARVPLVSGAINDENSKDLIELFRIIYDDDFLKKNIIGIEILPTGATMMSNRNYSYKIDFGRTINVESKLKNYKAFFQKAEADRSLIRYKKINLRFTQQVVCTKK